MTSFACLIVLRTMAPVAARRIEPSVNPVLIEIVAPVRKPSLGGTWIFLARFQLVLMRVAISTERDLVAGIA
jgi:hypothetical protein